MLKQDVTEAQTTWRHTPPAPPSTGPRFDKDGAAEILKTAARLQQGEQETLTQLEIEAMAAEMGIAPRHVRQAIALSGQRTTRLLSARRMRFSRQQKQFALFVPLLYSLYMVALVLATYRNTPTFVVNVSLFVLPFVLSALMGIRLGSKRAGAVAGSGVFAALALGIAVGTRLHQGHVEGPRPDDWGLLLLMIMGMVTSGVVGAAVQQWLAERRWPLAVALVRPSESDR